MFTKEIPDMEAARKLLVRGEVTVRDVMNIAMHNIQAGETTIRAFVHMDLDQAQATAMAMRPDQGCLAGMPVGAKDLFDVAGMPTTGGSRAYHWIAQADAPAVARWREAGAIVVGKTNTQELAYGVITAPTRNPWNPEHIPGGSSGGSAAALAAGMILAALGSDTGGSVRIPASCCGVVGFKPTYGRVPTEGVMPLSWTLDHVGPMGHSVTDVTRLYRILAGLELSGNESATTVRYRRAGIPWSYLDHRLTPAVRQAFEEALNVFRQGGWEFTTVEMEPWEQWRELQLTIRLPEAYVVHQKVLEGPKRQLLGGDLATRLDPGGTILAKDHARAQRDRIRLQAQWQNRLADLDVILMPTLATTAPRVGQDHLTIGGRDVSPWEALVALTAPWNVLGFPAISVPGGFDEQGLPIGLQIIGPSLGDDTVLDVSHWYEQHTDWHRREPPCLG